MLERAEIIKSILEKEKQSTNIGHHKEDFISETIARESQDQDLQMECEVLMNVDHVNCFSVMGKDKELIASGTLQLLKTRESGGLHFLKLEEFEFPLTKQVP